VADVDGNKIGVSRHVSGAIALEREWAGSTIILPAAERDRLRELLDRAAMPGQVPAAPDAVPDATDLFGGHEFAYESSSDLFRCVHCRVYEVTARKDGDITQCPGDVPGEPMELNAY
jgi:hypothetical protein